MFHVSEYSKFDNKHKRLNQVDVNLSSSNSHQTLHMLFNQIFFNIRYNPCIIRTIETVLHSFSTNPFLRILIKLVR